jgi:hypothetical protein
MLAYTILSFYLTDKVQCYAETVFVLPAKTFVSSDPLYCVLRYNAVFLSINSIPTSLLTIL